jgi:hypothetical protein
VTLHFAEIVLHDAGDRVFDVLLEGRKVLDGYSPGRKGFAAADARTFEVDVEDGVLDIEFARRSPNVPLVSAIEIAPAEGADGRRPPPSPVRP